MKNYLSQNDLDLGAINSVRYESLTQLLGILVTAVGPDFIMGEILAETETP